MTPSIQVIQLIGPGGAGKSTVGAALATLLDCAFLDLDREFERHRGDISAFIDAHGYSAYAHDNVDVYHELVDDAAGAVLALSSGFMVYPESVHPAYAMLRDAIARSPGTIVLLPSFERETCVAEIVRRQLGRSFGNRGAVREEALIRERFNQYRELSAWTVETMRPATEVAAAIHARIAQNYFIASTCATN